MKIANAATVLGWLLVASLVACESGGGSADVVPDTGTDVSPGGDLELADDDGNQDVATSTDGSPGMDVSEAQRSEPTLPAQPCGELACTGTKCAPFGQALALGRDHSCVITESSHVCCWGSSEYGQAGDGSAARVKRRAERVPGLEGVVGISAGENHTCAIVGEAREVWCWGLLDAATSQYLSAEERAPPGYTRGRARVERRVPAEPPVGATRPSHQSPGTKGISRLSCGSAYCCATTDDSGAMCFGLGAGISPTSSQSPHQVPLLLQAVQLSSRALVTYGLMPDGGVVFVRLVDGGTFESLPVVGLPSMRSVAAGETHACALTTDGAEIWCWKHAQRGLLSETSGPIGIVGVRHSGLNAGRLTQEVLVGCLVDAGNHLRCWRPGFGDDGPESAKDSPLWPLVAIDSPPVHLLTSGLWHTCVITDTGAVMCLGMSEWGQAGLAFPREMGPTQVASAFHPLDALRALTPNASIRTVIGTYRNSTILYDVGMVSWGGALAHHSLLPTAFGSYYWRSGYAVVPVRGGDGVAEATVGDDRVSDISDWSTGGFLPFFAWPSGGIFAGGSGELPNNAIADVLQTPVPTDVAQVTVGHDHICFHHKPGHVSCRGINSHGQCGVPPSDVDLVKTEQPIPDLIAPLALAAGARHTCALASDGRVLCWGDNTYLQLGHPTAPEQTYVPVEVDLPWPAVGLVAGGWHSCAWSEDRELWCWGADAHGESSAVDPTEDAPTTRLPAPTLDWAPTHVTAGHGFTCAVDSEGQGWCWGANGYAQLGTGDQIASGIPRKVDIPNPLVGLDAGYHHACAWDVEDEVYCWGRAAEGQLGLGYPWFPTLVSVEGMAVPEGTEPWEPEGPWPAPPAQ